MKFNILLANLKPHLWEMVSDTVHFVRGALEACGETVTVSTNQLDPDAINLFIDRFYEEPEFPLKLKAGGYRFGLVCTEVIGEDGSWNYGAEQDDPNVYALYRLAAEAAEFVWVLLEESLAACRAMNPNSAVLPLGYLDSIETLPKTPWESRDIDFLLCGFGSPRRGKVVQALAEAGHTVVYPAIPVPAYVRDSLMERTKINMSVQKTDRHGIVSATRLCHSIINRVPVLLEYSGGATPYDTYCLRAEPKTLVDDCLAALARDDLEAHAETAYRRFKEDRPMMSMMQRVLTETLRQ